MEAMPPSTTTSKTSKIPTQVIQRAVKALLKWKSSNPNTQNPSENDFFYLVLTLNKIPQNFRAQNPYKISLPHPLFSPYSPDFKICLLVADKYSLSTKQKIENENLPISNVIKLSKLRSNFKSFDEKKKLCDSYDVFLADKGLVSTLPKVLGRYFYKRKKGPVGIELGKSNWKEQIEGFCGSTMLTLKEGGVCNVIRVAGVEMKREKIVENVVAAVNGAVDVVPKKWKNVRALHLKLTESLALPIFEPKGSNGENGEVGSGGIVGEKRKIEDEEKEMKKKVSKEMDMAKSVTEKSSKKAKVLV